MTRPRLLLIGIDAATLDLVRPWVERGDLPALGALMRAGASGRLRSVPNMITPAAWTSFATGCNPGKHGIFYFTERVAGSYAERFINGAARAQPAFWMLASAHGVPTAVVNVPMTYPADPVNGVMVSGMDTPSVDAVGSTHPPELAADLLERFGFLLGPGSLSGAVGHLMLAGRLEAAHEVLVKRVEARTELCRYLMDRFPVDLFTLVHTEVDSIQHYFWKFIDPRLPDYTARGARRYGDGILRLYQKVDRSIEVLREAFGPANVMVMSDHGAGASPGMEDGVPWVRLVLEELGLSAPLRETAPLRRATQRTAATLYRTLNPRLPRPLRRLARRWTPSVVSAMKSTVKYRYDWGRTRAFCSGAAGDIWINLKGRDPEGLVEPGQEYEDIRERIREAFLTLREARSGQPLVEAVHYREEVYDGPFADRGPDLIVRFGDVVIDGVLMDGKILRSPRRAAASPKQAKSGSHRPEGVLILQGAGVRPGVELTGGTLVDLAPTILYWMGQPVPSYMDGRALTAAFAPEYLGANPVTQRVVPLEVGAPRESGYAEDETALVMERLRNLGYI